ncbi:hypothetical protein KAI56_00035 [Candidatus Parcubacteria bacterium]|nr:hypothetical protein [Candidatus Parcubacteria bacterium]
MEEKKETNINELSSAVNGLVGTVDKLAEMTQRGFEELKGEMKNEVGGLRGEMKNEVGGLRNEMNEKFNRVDKRFNQVLNNQDQVLKRLDNLESDNAMDMAVHRRQGDKLENHEKRIVIVEEKVLV